MRIQSFVRYGLPVLACFGCLLTQILAGDDRDQVGFGSQPSANRRQAVAGGARRTTSYELEAAPRNDRLPLLTEDDAELVPNVVHLGPLEENEEDEDSADDGILPVQEVAPLAPDARLRPSAPGMTPEGSESTRTMLGPPTLASLSSGRGRARALARGRSSAPAMIGDFFGGVPASGGGFLGPPIGPTAFMNNKSFLGGFTVKPGGNIITPNGQFFGLASGASLQQAKGVIFGPKGAIQAIPGLTQLNISSAANPVPGPNNPTTFVALATGGTTAGLLQFPTIPPLFDPGSPVFGIRPVLNVAFPDLAGSGGALIGREKIGENTSPMPRDRLFFNYSYFSGVPLSAGGVNVNRFTPGFEKTFFDGMTSFEMRFPFATTLDNNIIVDGSTNSGTLLFGDMSLVGKALLYTDDSLAISAGLQVALPTASDLHARLTDGTELVRVNNETVYLMPFLGALYTPDDRFFTQGFLQFDTPANANRVFVNNFNGSLDSAGKIRDVTFLFADLGAGYWLYRDDDAPRLTGFSTSLELHYNRSLQPTNVVTSGLYQIGSVANNIEMLNVVIGGHLHFNLNSTLSIAYVAPIGNSSDRVFNGELRAFYNYRFGPQTFRTRTTL